MIEASCDDHKCSIMENETRLPCKRVRISGGECKGAYKVQDQVGEGVFGTVYSITSESGCDYAFKVIKKPMLRLFNENEIEMQTRASKAGIASEILQITYNDDSIGIIMEKMDYTVYSFLKDISKLSIDARQIITIKLIKDVFELLEKLHSIDILHNDVHLSNIMWSTKKFKWMLIDFGSALLHSKSDIDLNEDFQLFIESIIATTFIDDIDINPDIIFRDFENVNVKEFWIKYVDVKKEYRQIDL